MKKHEVALNKSEIIFAGITTTLVVGDAFALGCVTATQFHLFTNWNRYSGKIDVSFLFMHFCPGTMTTHAELINSDLQRGLDRRLRHTQH